MQKTFILFALFTSFLLPMVACTPSYVCAPGETQVCACTNGTKGAQSCKKDRDSWGPCNCTEEPVPPEPVIEIVGGSDGGTEKKDEHISQENQNFPTESIYSDGMVETSICEPTCGSCELCVGGRCLQKAEGLPCEEDQNPCTSDICIQGVCSHPNKADGFLCGEQSTCLRGQCTKVDPCKGKDCGLYGRCQEGACVCLQGYKGVLCEQCDAGYAGYPNCLPCGQKNQACCEGVTCESGLTCEQGQCLCNICKPNEWSCGVASSKQCDVDGCSWKPDVVCSCGCAQGQCLSCRGPIVGGRKRILALALTTNGICWTEDELSTQSGKIYCSDMFGQNVQQIEQGLTSPTVLLAEGDTLFANDDLSGTGRLLKIDIKTGSSITLSSNVSFNRMAMDGTHLYFRGGNQFVRLAKVGGNLQNLATTTCSVNGIAVDTSHVYATCVGSYDFVTKTYTNGFILQVSKTGGAPTSVANQLGNPGVLLEQGGFLYWGEYSVTGQASGILRKMSTNGGAITDLASNIRSIDAMIFSNGFLYWTETSGSVRRVKTDGSQFQTLLHPTGSPSVLQADTTFLYWAEEQSTSPLVTEIVRWQP